MGDAATAVTVPRQQPRHYPDHTQPAGQPVGEWHAHKHRAGAMRGLLIQQAQARQDQGFPWNGIRQRMPLGPAADRRDNQSREVCGEQCVCQAMGLRHCRGEVVQQHISAGQQ
ncbi:hypothetical protein D3C73_1168090 [compost metagenome]